MENKISSFQKFQLLLWKNFLMQWNKKISLFAEILFPVLFCIIIVIIRMNSVPYKEDERRYPPVQIEELSDLWKRIQNLPRILAYSPKNEYLDKIVKDACTSLELEPLAYANARELNDAVSLRNFTAAIQFADILAYQSDYPKELEIHVRFPSVLRTAHNWIKDHPSASIWLTDRIRDPLPLLRPYQRNESDGGTPPGYIREGFVQIQHAVTMSYIKLVAKKTDLPKVVMRRTPYPPFVLDYFLMEIRYILPFLLSIGFAASSINIARYISQEKEKQLKEVMKIMGVPNWIHWLAWFLRSFFVLTLVSIIFVVILKVPVVRDIAVFNQSNWILLLLLFFVWSICLICFSFMMAIFFDAATTAASITGLIYFLLLIPLFSVYSAYNDLHFLLKLLICLNLNFGLGIAIYHISFLEGIGEGMQWSNLFRPLNEDDYLSLGLILIIMLIAAFLYMITCLYFEQVLPGEIGVPKSWFFPFHRSFWFPSKRKSSLISRRSTPIERIKAEPFEEEPKDARVGVEIKELGKRYGGKWAVTNLSLHMFENEITVLLGHNGSGKTTTISMLTGMIRPSRGTAFINGCDIRTDMDGARTSMGICPQNNVLFDDMSVANHLIFFTKLKGIRGRAVKIEVERLLEIMEMKQQANELPAKLSGGMKRKLCLCCALCGDSKVVFCDEPTSGMDPVARRQLWNLLQSEKIGRTVLLTTHFMDEADVLGDRIAIMCDGELRCHGTSFFLKKRFGSGHRLICVKTEDSDVEGLTKLLDRYIRGIQPESDIGSELTYRLPDEFISYYGTMLQELEQNIDILGFSEFGIGGTSLEEVFLKVSAENANHNLFRTILNSNASNMSLAEDESTTDKHTEEDTDKFKQPHPTRTKEIAVFDTDMEKDEKIKKRKRKKLPRIKGQTNLNSYFQGAEVTKQRFKEFDFKGISELKTSSEDFNNKEEHRSFTGKVALDKSSKLAAPFEKLEFFEREKSKGVRLLWAQWKAMLYKKLLFTCRNWVKVMFQNSVGVCFVTVAILSARAQHFKPLPPMTIGLEQYRKAVVVLEALSNENTNDSLEFKIEAKYKDFVERIGSDYKLVTTQGSSFEDFFLKVGRDNIVDINKDYIVGASIGKNEITAWFNNQIYHATPLALNLVHNAIAKALISDNVKITVINFPLPFTSETSEKNVFNNVAGDRLANFLGFSLSIATAFFIVFIITENESCYKLIQLVSGVRVSTFWLSHFLWDFLMLSVIVCRVIFSLAIFQEPGYSTMAELGVTIALNCICSMEKTIVNYIETYYFAINTRCWGKLTNARYSFLMAVFSFGIIPLTYLLASFFKDPVLGFTSTSILFIFSGVGLASMYGPMDTVNNNMESFKFYYVYIFFPFFSFTLGWKKLDFNTRKQKQCKSLQGLSKKTLCQFEPYCCREPIPYYALQSPGILLELLAMAITGVVLIIYLIARDYGCCIKCPTPKRYETGYRHQVLDPDVKAERERVKNMTEQDIAEYHLVIDRLAKFYGYRIAVNYISLSAKKRECFGLLGLNGAGKTRTLRMLTGAERISSGDAYVMGLSVRTKLLRVYRKIGFCPQYNSLQEDLTGREALKVFCLIVGIPRKEIQDVTEELADTFGFTKHLDARIDTYSAGNKRKVSTAIALLGAPSVIYLDEPTCGVDPASQRKIWNMLCLIRDAGNLIVLTTHNMGEVEALCTKAAIMVQGNIRCIGSIQQLKNKFLKGIVLKIQAERSSESQGSESATRLSMNLHARVHELKFAILTKYPRAIVRSEYQNLITIFIPLIGINWSEIFTWLEANRENLKFEDYSMSQTPLDEIFLDFAKQQEMEEI